jgi:hypothetical protein
MSVTVNTPANPYIRADIGVLATYLVNNLGLTQTVAQVQQVLQNYVTNNGNNPIPLAALLPDYDSNVGEMTNILSTYNSWQDLYTSGPGQTIIDMFATGITYGQMATEKAVQEAVLSTAVLSSSVYEYTKSNGVRIQRCIPGFINCTISIPAISTNSISLPAYTQFLVNGISFFNRNVITIPANTLNITATLYQGTVASINFTASGGNFQIYEFGNSDFAISDLDVIVNVNGTLFNNTLTNTYYSNGLWEYLGATNVYFESTNSAGNVEIQFGNNTYGVAPQQGALIEVTYVSTLGAAGNTNLSGNLITCPSNSVISGIVNSTTQNGANQKSANDYKYLTPALYAAKYRCVTIDDYQATAILYPGVIDAQFQGQAQFAPSNLAYMMNVTAFLLTNQVWSAAQWNAFTAWITPLGVANIVILQGTVTPVTLNISINVFCFQNADLNSVENIINSNITTAFQLGVGSLGYSWHLSDIENLIKKAAPSSIDYYEIVTPTAGVVVSGGQYVVLGTVTINMAYTTRVVR